MNQVNDAVQSGDGMFEAISGRWQAKARMPSTMERCA